MKTGLSLETKSSETVRTEGSLSPFESEAILLGPAIEDRVATEELISSLVVSALDSGMKIEVCIPLFNIVAVPPEDGMVHVDLDLDSSLRMSFALARRSTPTDLGMAASCLFLRASTTASSFVLSSLEKVMMVE